MYRLRVTVDEIKGFCDLPMKVGDYFEVDGGRLIIPSGKYVCIWALSAIMPFLTAKQREITEENDWLPTTSKLACPDPNGCVIYKVERILPKEPDQGHHRDEDLKQNEDIPKRLLVKEDACSGCRRCELGCSFHHLKMYWPHKAFISILKDEHHGADRPLVCRQCGVAKCVEACGFSALTRDPVTKAVLVDKSKCKGCLACVRACPFGGIRPGEEGFPLVCDLCGGNPACVEVCPTGTLVFGRAGEIPPEPKFKQPGKERAVMAK